MEEAQIAVTEQEPQLATAENNGSSQKVASDPANGYIFLCRNSTQLECLEKKLFAATDRDLDRLVAHISEGTKLFLVNIHSGVIVGVFTAVGGPDRDIEPHAFGGGFSAQVRVAPLNEPLLATRLTWPVGSGPRSAQDVEYLQRLLLGGEQIDPFAVDPHDYTFRPTGKGYPSNWGYNWGSSWDVAVPDNRQPAAAGKGGVRPPGPVPPGQLQQQEAEGSSGHNSFRGGAYGSDYSTGPSEYPGGGASQPQQEFFSTPPTPPGRPGQPLGMAPMDSRGMFGLPSGMVRPPGNYDTGIAHPMDGRGHGSSNSGSMDPYAPRSLELRPSPCGAMMDLDQFAAGGPSHMRQSPCGTMMDPDPFAAGGPGQMRHSPCGEMMDPDQFAGGGPCQMRHPPCSEMMDPDQFSGGGPGPMRQGHSGAMMDPDQFAGYGLGPMRHSPCGAMMDPDQFAAAGSGQMRHSQCGAMMDPDQFVGGGPGSLDAQLRMLGKGEPLDMPPYGSMGGKAASGMPRMDPQMLRGTQSDFRADSSEFEQNFPPAAFCLPRGGGCKGGVGDCDPHAFGMQGSGVGGCEPHGHGMQGGGVGGCEPHGHGMQGVGVGGCEPHGHGMQGGGVGVCDPHGHGMPGGCCVPPPNVGCLRGVTALQGGFDAMTGAFGGDGFMCGKGCGYGGGEDMMGRTNMGREDLMGGKGMGCEDMVAGKGVGCEGMLGGKGMGCDGMMGGKSMGCDGMMGGKGMGCEGMAGKGMGCGGMMGGKATGIENMMGGRAAGCESMMGGKATGCENMMGGKATGCENMMGGKATGCERMVGGKAAGCENMMGGKTVGCGSSSSGCGKKGGKKQIDPTGASLGCENMMGGKATGCGSSSSGCGKKGGKKQNDPTGASGCSNKGRKSGNDHMGEVKAGGKAKGGDRSSSGKGKKGGKNPSDPSQGQKAMAGKAAGSDPSSSGKGKKGGKKSNDQKGEGGGNNKGRKGSNEPVGEAMTGGKGMGGDPSAGGNRKKGGKKPGDQQQSDNAMGGKSKGGDPFSSGKGKKGGKQPADPQHSDHVMGGKTKGGNSSSSGNRKKGGNTPNDPLIVRMCGDMMGGMPMDGQPLPSGCWRKGGNQQTDSMGANFGCSEPSMMGACKGGPDATCMMGNNAKGRRQTGWRDKGGGETTSGGCGGSMGPEFGGVACKGKASSSFGFQEGGGFDHPNIQHFEMPSGNLPSGPQGKGGKMPANMANPGFNRPDAAGYSCKGGDGSACGATDPRFQQPFGGREWI